MTIEYISQKLQEVGIQATGSYQNLPIMILDAVDYVRELGADAWLNQTTMSKKLKDIVINIANNY